MKYLILSALIMFALGASGQPPRIPEQFHKELYQLLESDLTKESVLAFFRKYDTLLTAPPERAMPYPLAALLSDPNYQKAIDNLLLSNDRAKNALGHMLIRGVGDHSKELILLKDLQNQDTQKVYNAAVTLFQIKSARTTPLFDFLVKYEDFGDAHFVPLLFALDKDSLEQTAYDRINSEDIHAKILAVQLFKVTGWNPRTDSLIKRAIKELPVHAKGYAIVPAGELNCGTLLAILKPLVDSLETREVALKSLLNSPTKGDREFASGLLKSSSKADNELLNAFLTSNRLDNIKQWLGVLSTTKVDSTYSFINTAQPRLREDSMLLPLQAALRKIGHPSILQELLRALRGRTDKQSLSILVNFLDHRDQLVRYWAAYTLQGNEAVKDPEVLKKIDVRLKDEE